MGKFGNYGWGSWVPRYTNKQNQKNLPCRFFKILLIVYFRIRHTLTLWRIQLPQIK